MTITPPACLAIQPIVTVYVFGLDYWKRMRRNKSWRAHGKNAGGQIIALDFVPTTAVHREIVREVMKTARWCSVVHEGDA